MLTWSNDVHWIIISKILSDVQYHTWLQFLQTTLTQVNFKWMEMLTNVLYTPRDLVSNHNMTSKNNVRRMSYGLDLVGSDKWLDLLVDLALKNNGSNSHTLFSPFSSHLLKATRPLFVSSTPTIFSQIVTHRHLQHLYPFYLFWTLYFTIYIIHSHLLTCYGWQWAYGGVLRVLDVVLWSVKEELLSCDGDCWAELELTQKSHLSEPISNTKPRLISSSSSSKYCSLKLSSIAPLLIHLPTLNKCYFIMYKYPKSISLRTIVIVLQFH